MKNGFFLILCSIMSFITSANERIVTIGGDITEIVFALGGQADYCKRQYQLSS